MSAFDGTEVEVMAVQGTPFGFSIAEPPVKEAQSFKGTSMYGLSH